MTAARERSPWAPSHRVASRDERTHMLQGLLELSPGDLDEIVRTRVSTLPTDARERLLRGR